jgi:signal-transduction protein with cAMP-binding, CBS, and nucleotidyltransferase domain
MSESIIVRVADVMKRDVDIVDGKLTVKEALMAMRYPETRALIINKRDDDDEYGIVLLTDIAKKVLAADRSPERTNLYEIMSKPVLSVHPQMNIRYCAQLLERFSIMRTPVIEDGKVIGVVSYHDLVLRGLMQMIRTP